METVLYPDTIQNLFFSSFYIPSCSILKKLYDKYVIQGIVRLFLTNILILSRLHYVQVFIKICDTFGEGGF